MASKSKKTSPVRRSVKSRGAWQDYIFGLPAKNVAIVAAAIAAILYLDGNIFRPIYTSGPPPFPSRLEVEALRLETQMNFDGVKKGIDETLETAKAARQEAQQAIAKSDSNRLTRLLALKTELESKMRTTPDDKIIAQVLAQTNIDIATLSAEASLVKR